MHFAGSAAQRTRGTASWGERDHELACGAACQQGLAAWSCVQASLRQCGRKARLSRVLARICRKRHQSLPESVLVASFLARLRSAADEQRPRSSSRLRPPITSARSLSPVSPRDFCGN